MIPGGRNNMNKFLCDILAGYKVSVSDLFSAWFWRWGKEKYYLRLVIKSLENIL